MPDSCTVVVPCYNEAGRLKVDAFRSYIARSPEVNFLFVNDGSNDATLEVLEQVRSGLEQTVTILDKQPNGGKGEAVRAGMIYAFDTQLAAVAGFWDADLATPLDAISDLNSVLRSNPEIQMVFGSRVRLLGRRIERQPMRHYLGRVFATVVSTMLRMPVYDTQCGAKLFRYSPAIRQALNEPFESRWVFDVEILARLLQRGDVHFLQSAIYEYPLHDWRDVAGSKLRPVDFIRAVNDTWTIYRRYLRRHSGNI
ncbi:MAG: glycosyltransferase [Bryobacteraceae bacterium]